MVDNDLELNNMISTVNSTVLSLIDEKTVQGIAEKLNKVLGRAIIIEDSFFRILGKYPDEITPFNPSKPQLNDSFIREYVHRIQVEKVPQIMPPLPQYGVRQSRIVFPIMTGNVIHGYLHAFDKNTPPSFSSGEKKYIMEVLIALAIRALKEEYEIQARKIIIGNLYRKLIIGHFLDAKAMQEAIGMFGVDLSIPTWLLLTHIDDLGTGDDCLAALKSFLAELAPCAQFFPLDDCVFLILITEQSQSYKKAAIMSLAHQLIDDFKKHYTKAHIRIAFGRKCLNLSDYTKSYQEGLKALNYLLTCSKESQVLPFSSLGIVGVATIPEDVENLLSFAQKTLLTLLENDKQNPAMKLVQTLDAFLRNDSQFKETAKDLFIHVNTLRYRLAKIREIGGFDLDNAEVKFQLFLALKILNLQQTLAHCTRDESN